MTGAAEIITRLEALGTVLALGPGGRIDCDAPAVPEAERLLDDLAAVSDDAKRLLRERPAHRATLPATARTETSRAGSIPPETSPDEGAATVPERTVQIGEETSDAGRIDADEGAE